MTTTLLLLGQGKCTKHSIHWETSYNNKRRYYSLYRIPHFEFHLFRSVHSSSSTARTLIMFLFPPFHSIAGLPFIIFFMAHNSLLILTIFPFPLSLLVRTMRVVSSLLYPEYYEFFLFFFIFQRLGCVPDLKFGTLFLDGPFQLFQVIFFLSSSFASTALCKLKSSLQL